MSKSDQNDSSLQICPTIYYVLCRNGLRFDTSREIAITSHLKNFDVQDASYKPIKYSAPPQNRTLAYGKLRILARKSPAAVYRDLAAS
jgi:hypothetical protein